MDVSLKNDVIRFVHAREFKMRKEKEKEMERKSEDGKGKEEKEKEQKVKGENEKEKEKEKEKEEELLKVTYDDLIVVVWDEAESQFVIQNKKHLFSHISSVTDCEGIF